jgi:hypothetical protein
MKAVADMQNLSYYGNLRYEFKPGYFLYMGLKSQQARWSLAQSPIPWGSSVGITASAYLKVALTL